MSRFWKKFFKRFWIQIRKAGVFLMVAAGLALVAIIWIGAGMLFLAGLVNYFSMQEETAAALAILFSISWPVAIIWITKTVVEIKDEIQEENRKILWDIEKTYE